MGQEEDVLFPVYENKTGAPFQPTTALREEHEHIVQIIRNIAEHVDERDIDALRESLGYLETLFINHHEKEELTFLPMAARILFDERETLKTRLNEYPGPKQHRDFGIAF